MLGILADEAALVAAEEMVAANKTVKEAMADEQHIIDVADSDSDDSDGASSDGFRLQERRQSAEDWGGQQRGHLDWNAC